MIALNVPAISGCASQVCAARAGEDRRSIDAAVQAWFLAPIDLAHGGDDPAGPEPAVEVPLLEGPTDLSGI